MDSRRSPRFSKVLAEPSQDQKLDLSSEGYSSLRALVSQYRYNPTNSPSSSVATSSAVFTTAKRTKTTLKRAISAEDIGKAKKRAKSSTQELKPLNDILAPSLNVVFTGYNPGIQSSARGHHFAGPTNLFWPCLSQSGLVTPPVTYEDDIRCPRDFNVGFTNLVPRVTPGSADLTKNELKEGVKPLLEKLRIYKPKVVCFVGMDVFRNFVNHCGVHELQGCLEGKEEVKVEGFQVVESRDIDFDDMTSRSEGELDVKVKGGREDTVVTSDISISSNRDDPIAATSLATNNTTSISITRSYLLPSSKRSRNPSMKLGLQPIPLVHPDASKTWLYVVPSTSGRVSHYTRGDRYAMFRTLKEVVDWSEGPGREASRADWNIGKVVLGWSW